MLHYVAVTVVLIIARVSSLSVAKSEKVCFGTDDTDWIHANNIRLYNGCTKVVGNLQVLLPTFNGDPWRSIPPLEASALDALKNIRVVTGCVILQGQGMTNLDFLSNLEVIEGKDTYRNYSLVIYAQNLKTLDLVSLREVQNGRVWIARNQNLCLADTIDWSEIAPAGYVVKKNKSARNCREDGYTCAEECTFGCWGKGRDKCFKPDRDE